MLQKLAFAVKSKTIEFFADEGEDDAANDELSSIPLATEEVITGQRVVVLKPDPPPLPDPTAILAIVSSFRAAYLHLQTAHSPFDPDAVLAADRSAVSHLRRLSDLKNPNPNPSLLSSHLQAQVQDNQTLLRTYSSIIDHLQSEMDRKDAAAASLEQTLGDAEAVNLKLEGRLAPPDDRVEAFLSVSVFDSVLRDSYRATHNFTRFLIDLMEQSGWDLRAAADSIYPGVVYAKPRHCQYAILSYVCSGLFGGFGSGDFGCGEGRIELEDNNVDVRRMNSLKHFIEHSSVDPIELIEASPGCDFAIFCKKKHESIISSGIKSSLFENPEQELTSGSLQPSNPLYEQFVNMASSVWMLHKLALAYEPVVDIFQVGRGAVFSMVYMESVARSTAPLGSRCRKDSRPKVGFVVVPGFRVGKTVIQCRVYLDES